MTWDSVSSVSIADSDQEVIRALARAGADLTQPRDVRHYLYVPNEKIATLMAPRLEQLGFTAETKPEVQGSRWLVLIRSTVVVTEEQIASFREAFEAFALKLGGEYDGWEAAAKP